MSVLGKFSRNLLIACNRRNVLRVTVARTFSSKPGEDSAPDKEPGWLTRLLSSKTVDRIETGHESHSRMLADKETVYELQIHAVHPASMEEYLNRFQQFVDMVHRKKTGAELAGSWTVEIGDQDEAIHLWKYPGGYPVLNRAREIYRTDKEFLEFRAKRNEMLRHRKNQILLAFSFWGDIQPRDPSWIYELRSYTLKPGTMIEWGNNWAKGLKARRHNSEPVAGFFCNIGEVYSCHHIWAYESLQSRKEVREAAWQRPGWDECVAYTVPLIRHMTSRILIPTPFSPMQ